MEVPSDREFSAQFRAHTPGVAKVVHLNAAGAGLPPRVVTETVVAHLQREASVGPHWAAEEARERLTVVRQSAATIFGCHSRNVAFGPSAGRLWAMAFLSRALPRGARVLMARSEWVSNVLNLLKLQGAGSVAIKVMPVDERTGLIDVDQVASLIDERTVAICLPLVSSGCGLPQPVERLAALSRPPDCLLFLDAAQAVGNRSVKLGETGADIIVAPGRKWLRGPRGEAFMALSDRALATFGDPPLLDQTGAPWKAANHYQTLEDARRYETYDFSAAGRLGLGAAIDHALTQGIDCIRETIQARLRRLHAGLGALPGIRIFEDIKADPAFLTFVVEDIIPAVLNQYLAEAGIAAAIVDRSYARLDFEARGLDAVNRVAPHAYTSEAEIERFVNVIDEALARARRTLHRATD